MQLPFKLGERVMTEGMAIEQAKYALIMHAITPKFVISQN